MDVIQSWKVEFQNLVDMVTLKELKPELTGYEKGQLTELGAVNVMTGIYTGRSPKDKYIVMDENSKDTVWWNTPDYPNDNHVLSEDKWAVLKDIALKQLRIILHQLVGNGCCATVEFC